jgi:hypothetical protein
VDRPSAGDLWLAGCGTVLFWAIAGYYLRVAYGWVELDPAGVRTSRLIRGRFVQWTEIQRLTTRTYTGRAGRVTVVKVHTTSGHTFLLPAPRTTAREDQEFSDALRHLQSRIPKMHQ